MRRRVRELIADLGPWVTVYLVVSVVLLYFVLGWVATVTSPGLGGGELGDGQTP